MTAVQEPLRRLAALAERPSLQHKLRCLRYGHKIARHRGVGNRNRFTAFYLLIEDRDYTSRRTQHVAEPDGHKSGYKSLIQMLDNNLSRAF